MGMPVPEEKEPVIQRVKVGSKRNWFPGMAGHTDKGDFVVLRSTKSGWLVQYTSGEWDGKFIEMPSEVAGKTKAMESLRMKKEDKEKLLDMFYNDYPQEYTGVYNLLYRYSKNEPTTDAVMNLIREDYPPLFQLILNKFLQSSK